MVTMNDGMYSSNEPNTKTPKWLAEDLLQVFSWDIDVCSDEPNICRKYFDKEVDGLRQEWLGLCWMNPPYGREIGRWVEKARYSFGNVVCLLPARTDTKWWHNNVPHASFVVFIRGRLQFEGTPTNAPFPSCFVVFGSITIEQQDKLGSYGWSISEWL